MSNKVLINKIVKNNVLGGCLCSKLAQSVDARKFPAFSKFMKKTYPFLELRIVFHEILKKINGFQKKPKQIFSVSSAH